MTYSGYCLPTQSIGRDQDLITRLAISLGQWTRVSSRY
jgi:hypothetical protein